MSPALKAFLIILLVVLVAIGVAAARAGPACENPATLGAIAEGDVAEHTHRVCLDEAGRGVSNVADAGLGAHRHAVDRVVDAGVVGPAAAAPHTHRVVPDPPASLAGAIRRG